MVERACQVGLLPEEVNENCTHSFVPVGDTRGANFSG